MSKSDVLDVMAAGRGKFTTEEWKSFLIRSIGLEPAALDERAKRVALLRMVAFVERNYNLVELGPRGTARAICFSRSPVFSPDFWRQGDRGEDVRQ